MKTICVIPARYKSSRFPGKPLADIKGKPMIWWVYNQAKKAEGLDGVYVATDDDRIKNQCKALNMDVVMTSEDHETGTDRVGEVAKKIDADFIINVQGDEPLVEPENISLVVEELINNDLQVVNLMTQISNPVDVVNTTVPKVITNKEDFGIYLTRSQSPYPKKSLDFNYFKQVCVYGFTRKALNSFCENPRGKIEKIEDIEILRFIENGIKVKFIEVDSSTIAVDTPKDLEKVRDYVKNEK